MKRCKRESYLRSDGNESRSEKSSDFDGGNVCGVVLGAGTCGCAATSPGKPTVGLVVKVMTRTEGVDFSAYTRQAVSTIRHRLERGDAGRGEGGRKGLVVVRVQIQRDGTFVNQTPQIERSSNRQASTTLPLRRSGPRRFSPSSG